MKLGKRLKKIESMVRSGSYNHIWDCCCDHGFLGAALLSRLAAPSIHFVDIVPELMIQLEGKLQRFSSDSSSKWKIHCLDLADLSLKQYEGKQLVIIAGVGGDLITRLVNTLHQNHLEKHIDFLLCPVYHQFTLRRQLIQLDFDLINEVLVEENQRFYEILLVSTPTSRDTEQGKISPVGELIWQASTDDQAKNTVDYLNKTLNHYEKIAQQKNADVQHIIDAYRSVIL